VVGLLVAFIINVSGGISVYQEVQAIEITVSGKISDFEVTDFSYEGIITVDIKGDVFYSKAIEKFINSPLREVEIKKNSAGNFRVIFKFTGPIKLLGAEQIKGDIKIRVHPEASMLRLLSSISQGPTGTPISSSTASTRIVKETLYIESSAPVFLRCRNLSGRELSDFLYVSLGKRVSLPPDSIYNFEKREKSLEDFIKSFELYGK
jgi:hypothetical protein